jgi:hypothetical protein
MNKNTIFVLAFLVVGGLTGFLLWNQSNNNSVSTTNNGDFLDGNNVEPRTEMESDFADAVSPSDDDNDQAERLWPHAFKAPDIGLKERVAEEWKQFSAKYPNNIYIPSMFRSKPMTKEEETMALETLDSVTSQESNIAAFVSNNRYATGEAPEGLKEKDVNPKEQARYFDYKIRELQSRIQLIENFLESGEADASQRSIAQDDLKSWKEELKKITEVSKKVPTT